MTRTSAVAGVLAVLADDGVAEFDVGDGGATEGAVEDDFGAGWNSAIASPTAANWSLGLRIFVR
jgi:hypothetical protein